MQFVATPPTVHQSGAQRQLRAPGRDVCAMRDCRRWGSRNLYAVAAIGTPCSSVVRRPLTFHRIAAFLDAQCLGRLKSRPMSRACLTPDACSRRPSTASSRLLHQVVAVVHRENVHTSGDACEQGRTHNEQTDERMAGHRNRERHRRHRRDGVVRTFLNYFSIAILPKHVSDSARARRVFWPNEEACLGRTGRQLASIGMESRNFS
jgi:hypothetical protein